MTKASISQAKDRLSALIKKVQSGESVLITDRGVPVAELVPVRLGRGVPARILGLAQEGLVRLPEETPDADWLDLPRPSPTPGPSAVDLLLQERREGR
jgi:prevent-host-death family protein